MAKLIDLDVFRSDHKMAEFCNDCKRDEKWECDKQMYSARDICGWLDDAETVDAIPIGWLERRLNETAVVTPRGDDQTELNNAIFQVLVEWEKERRKNGEA